MKLSSNQGIRLLGWVGIIAAIVVVYVYYFFVYVPNQETKLNKRGFRILTDYSKTIDGRLGYFQKRISEFGKYYLYDDFLKEDTVITWLTNQYYTPESGIEFFNSYNSFKKTVHDQAADKNIKLSKSTPIEDSTGNYLSNKEFRFYHKYAFSSNNMLEIKQAIDSVMDYQHSQKTIKFTVHANDFMKGLRYDHLFNHLLLVNDNQIIHNNSLISKRGNPDFTDENELHILIKNLSKNKPDLKLSGNLNQNEPGIFGEEIFDIVLQGESHKVFVLPNVLDNEKMFLWGILKSSTYTKLTRSVSNMLLIILLGIVLLIISSLPIIKIAAINDRERLGINDANFSIISLLFGLMVVTLLLSVFLRHGIIGGNKLENIVFNTSEKHLRNFETDIEQIFDIYLGIRNDEKLSSNKIVKDALKDIAENKRYLNKASEDESKAVLPQEISFPLNEILLVDAKGGVNLYEDDLSIKASLKDREYFKMANQPDKLWDYTYKNQRIRFYIQSIRSYASGKPEAAISFPYDTLGVKVLALTSQLPSLYNQVMPKHCNFMLLNLNGDILFHSNHAINLHENIFNETNFNAELLSAVSNRVSRQLQINYKEKRWKVRVEPVANMPFVHLTLLDLDDYRLSGTRVFLYTFYMMLALLTIILLVNLFSNFAVKQNYVLEDKQNLFAWVRYKKSKTDAYKSLLFVFSVLVLISLFPLLPKLIQHPLSVFYHYTIVVLLSFYASTYLLIPNDNTKLFSIKPLNSSLILFIIILLIIAFCFSLPQFWKSTLLYFPLVFAFVILVKNVHKIDSIPVLSSLNSSISRYYSFSLLWILLLIILPTIGIFSKVYRLDSFLMDRESMKHIAVQNIHLLNSMPTSSEGDFPNWFINAQGNEIGNFVIEEIKKDEDDWLKQFRISDSTNQKIISKPTNGLQGENKIIPNAELTPDYSSTQGDGLSEHAINNSDEIHSIIRMNKADSIYSKLQLPLNRRNDPFAYLQSVSDLLEWKYVKSNTLWYSTPESKTAIKVSKIQDTDKSLSISGTSILFIVLLFVLLVLFWQFFRYYAKHALNTGFVDWPFVRSIKFLQLLKRSNKLVLVSFDPDYYIDKLDSSKIENIEAEHLLKGRIKDDLPNKERYYIIRNLADYIYQIEHHERLLGNLMDLAHKLPNKAVLIVCMPFHYHFAKEYLSNWSHKHPKSNEMDIYAIKKLWGNLFNGFTKYVGKSIRFNRIDHLLDATLKPDDTIGDYTAEQVISKQQMLEPAFYYVWNHLTDMEKLILYDLADDGLMNIKNRVMINRLISIGIINVGETPEFFDPSFKHFVLTSLRGREAKAIERKNSKDGMWGNTRVVLAVVLIAIVAFVFTTQNSSVDKILGIITGSVAVVSTLLKVFGSSGSSVEVEG